MDAVQRANSGHAGTLLAQAPWSFGRADERRDTSADPTGLSHSAW
jgi:hypothetical protein